ncbi:MAG TPA: hypothetical protein VN493_04340 [Thermoanaerobaculia bacterium]|nr:hypothetical protein [Thermoanaerobaculia bacterium]
MPGRPQAGGGTPPWEIPADAFGSQRLYRVNYSGPEGEGSFRVTLRLASPIRYQIQAVDPVGRALWGLDVTSEKGVWLDHRNKVTCAFEGSFDVSGIPLGPFPLLSLPSLLMGRVPAEPSGEVEPERKGKRIELRDDIGRRWAVDLGDGGTVEGWTLWDQEQPAVWFMRRDTWAYLSDRSKGVQVRWREVLRENLEREPEPLATPAAVAGYRESSCRDLYPPA